MSSRHWNLLALASLALAATISQADDEPVRADLAALKAAGEATDNKSLLDFIRKRTVSEALRLKIGGLIRELGHDEYATRTRAQEDLIEIGAPARPQLRAVLNDRDLEIRTRARRALTKIGTAGAEANVVAAATRVLAARKAAGACEVLLDYLPSIEEIDSAEEVAAVLAQLALDKDGKPEPALLRAMSDKHAVKRWAAAGALARASNNKEHRTTVRKVLEDADPGVRRHVAMALLEAKDRDAVPALIALLSGKSRGDAAAAEDVLVSIAGDSAPSSEGDTPNARLRYRKAWEGWWNENKEKIDLAKIDYSPVGHGLTVVGVLAPRKGLGAGNKVLVLDANMKLRWEVDASYPVYACLTRRDRVLICEYNLNRIVERDSKGEVIFQKNLGSQVVHAQRLRNGNTFIVTRNQLLEVSRDGREVKTVSRPGDILSACRHKDGTFSVVTINGTCLKLDSSGRQTSSFSVSVVNLIGLKVHFLPKGGVVVPDYVRGKVREYDSAGKVVVEFDAYRPGSVTRLTNGNYLVASRLNSTLIEYDRNGRQVTSHIIPGTARPIFAERK
jgi:HEAT repeat protein